MKGFIEKPIEQIEQKIETAKNKRKKFKAEAARAGQTLLTATEPELKQLITMVGSNDFKYTSIADKIANEILQCSIDYFNDCQDKDSNHDYAGIAIELAKKAQNIAIGKLTKDRAKENIATMAAMKDREISQAISVLSSIKEAYEEACKKIDEQVDELQYYTLNFSTSEPPIRVPKDDVSINWSKVEEMKRKCLAWDKVTEMICTIIPLQNIEKIKKTSDPTKINEYKSLVYFLLSKVSSTYKKKVLYINYWDAPSASSMENSTNKTNPSTGTDQADEILLWVKWVSAVITLIFIIKACN
jgi:hypothetical protein